MKPRIRYLLICLLCAVPLAIGTPDTKAEEPLKFPTTRKEITEELGKTPSKSPLGNPKGFGSSKGPGEIVNDDRPRVGALIHFDFDSDAIKPESHSLLREYGASFSEDLPDAVFIIEGHADSTGTDEYNKWLSYRRAESVKKFLVRNFDIKSSRLTIEAYGERRPRKSNATEAGRAYNRRVEFVRVK